MRSGRIAVMPAGHNMPLTVSAATYETWGRRRAKSNARFGNMKIALRQKGRILAACISSKFKA